MEYKIRSRPNGKTARWCPTCEYQHRKDRRARQYVIQEEP